MLVGNIINKKLLLQGSSGYNIIEINIDAVYVHIVAYPAFIDVNFNNRNRVSKLRGRYLFPS